MTGDGNGEAAIWVGGRGAEATFIPSIVGGKTSLAAIGGPADKAGGGPLATFIPLLVGGSPSFLAEVEKAPGGGPALTFIPGTELFVVTGGPTGK
jgi:hypothetical protein